VSTTKTSAGRPASLAQEKILTALRELARASAVQIGEHAKLAYSTTTANLRALQAAGLARRERHPDGTMTWQPAGTTPGPGATPQSPEPHTPDGHDAKPPRSKRKPAKRQAPTTGPVPEDGPPRTDNHAAGQARPAPGDRAPSAAGSKRSGRAGRHGASPEGGVTHRVPVGPRGRYAPRSWPYCRTTPTRGSRSPRYANTCPAPAPEPSPTPWTSWSPRAPPGRSPTSPPPTKPNSHLPSGHRAGAPANPHGTLPRPVPPTIPQQPNGHVCAACPGRRASRRVDHRPDRPGGHHPPDFAGHATSWPPPSRRHEPTRRPVLPTGTP
jgi:hypothetical protein